MSSENVHWHKAFVSKEDREELLNQKGFILWFTGLSGSGKSTIATLVERRLHEEKKLTYILDGDNLRHGLNKNLSFSKEDRVENIRRTSEVCNLFLDLGVVTLVTLISPYLKDREALKERFKEKFIEVFVDCPIEICAKRDPKGLYKKASAGNIENFTGYDSDYEAPVNPDIIIKTNENSVEKSIGNIFEYLKDKELLD